MERIGGVFMPIVLVVMFVFLVTFVYGVVTNKAYEDEDDTVTITFNCGQVLAMEEQYPPFVVTQCKKLKNTGTFK